MEVIKMINLISVTVVVVCWAILMLVGLVCIARELILDWLYERRRKK